MLWEAATTGRMIPSTTEFSTDFATVAAVGEAMDSARRRGTLEQLEKAKGLTKEVRISRTDFVICLISKKEE